MKSIQLSRNQYKIYTVINSNKNPGGKAVYVLYQDFFYKGEEK